MNANWYPSFLLLKYQLSPPSLNSFTTYTYWSPKQKQRWHPMAHSWGPTLCGEVGWRKIHQHFHQRRIDTIYMLQVSGKICLQVFLLNMMDLLKHFLVRLFIDQHIWCVSNYSVWYAHLSSLHNHYVQLPVHGLIEHSSHGPLKDSRMLYQ